MKKLLLTIVALVLLVISVSGCGTNTHEEIKVINGVKLVCSWTEPAFNPDGKKDDYICQGMAVLVEGETTP